MLPGAAERRRGGSRETPISDMLLAEKLPFGYQDDVEHGGEYSTAGLISHYFRYKQWAHNSAKHFDAICLQEGSSSEAIFKSMSQELVPAGPLALKQEKEQITLDG